MQYACISSRIHKYTEANQYNLNQYEIKEYTIRRSIHLPQN